LLNADSILRKTDKGVEELETRAYHLPAKLRAALILVDGSSTIGTILDSCGEFAERVAGQLNELLESGFIEADVQFADAEIRDMRDF